MYKFIFVFFCLTQFNLLGQSDSLTSINENQNEEKIYDSRIRLIFGWFLPSIQSSAQLNTSSGDIGATINLETTFKLPTSRKLFRISGVYRFNNHSSVDLYYYVLNRSGSNISADSLPFGNIIIQVGSSMQTFFNLSMFGGRYHYSILNEKNIEAGLSAGISFLYVDLGTTIKLNNRSYSESYSDLLFLPVFGFFNRVNFGDNFIFRDRVDLFSLNMDRYDGLLIDLGFSFEYLVYNHISLGVGYDAFTLNVAFDTRKSGRIMYEQRGFILFANLSF